MAPWRTILFAACAGALLVQIAWSDPAWLGGFTERVLKEGKPASLPPHLSLVLGLGDGEKATAVKQAGVRTGTVVHTFNVATVDRHHRVVLIKHDETTQLTEAILLRTGGRLERAVAYKTGAAPQALPDVEARAALHEELEVWGQQAAPQ